MRPMPEEVPALTGRTRLVVGVAVGLVLAAALVLRFWTRSGLWLDEALTVDVARLPLHEIPNALKHDGAPPLYYYLLHFWIALFGQSNVAVRSLSGVIAVLTLPVAWLCGKRFGGRALAWTLLVLVASAPFAVYYATESRMYALVILLTGCGILALQRAITAPRPGNLIAVAVVTAALLYAQYWSIYLVGMVGIWLVVSVVRTRRQGHPEASPWAALIAVAAGGLLFVPWVPTFLYQTAAHGDPVGRTAELLGRDQRGDRLHRQPGLDPHDGHEPGPPAGRHLLLHAGAGGVRRRPQRPHHRAGPAHPPPRPGRGLRRDRDAVRRHRRRHRDLERVLLALCGRRLPPLPSAGRPRHDDAAQPQSAGDHRRAGGGGGPRVVLPERDHAAHAGQHVAAALNAQARPGDVIAFCPDQLGPSVVRQLDHPSQYHMVTFPRRTAPQIVDWVDYSDTVGAANANDFADAVFHSAGTTHHIWLVWYPMYQTFGTKCEAIASTLLAAATKSGGGGRNVVTGRQRLYYEPMSLTEYTKGP